MVPVGESTQMPRSQGKHNKCSFLGSTGGVWKSPHSQGWPGSWADRCMALLQAGGPFRAWKEHGALHLIKASYTGTHAAQLVTGGGHNGASSKVRMCSTVKDVSW